jgi:RNA polymerase sigma-70 factor (ECF subfamily)
MTMPQPQMPLERPQRRARPAAALDLADPQVFSQVYGQHAHGTYRAALNVLGDDERAHDVAQDVFLRLWFRPQAFDASRGDLGAYLRMRARSRALDLWREGQAAARAEGRLRLATTAARGDGRLEEHPEPAAVRAGDRAALLAALRRLPAVQREAVLLAYWCGLTADQIATLRNVPLGTAKSRLRLGLAKLRLQADPLP